MDPISAVVGILKEELVAKLGKDRYLFTLAEGIADRVDGGELPRECVNKQPQEWVVVRPSGGASIGPGARSYAPWVNSRMDIRCYGQTPFLSYRVYDAVYKVMVELERRTIGDVDVGEDAQETITISGAVVTGGPIPGRDPDSDWPFTLGVFDVSSTYEVSMTK